MNNMHRPSGRPHLETPAENPPASNVAARSDRIWRHIDIPIAGRGDQRSLHTIKASCFGPRLGPTIHIHATPMPALQTPGHVLSTSCRPHYGLASIPHTGGHLCVVRSVFHQLWWPDRVPGPVEPLPPPTLRSPWPQAGSRSIDPSGPKNPRPGTPLRPLDRNWGDWGSPTIIQHPRASTLCTAEKSLKSIARGQGMPQALSLPKPPLDNPGRHRRQPPTPWSIRRG